MNIKRTGTVRVFGPSALINMGTVYRTTLEALAQAVENSADAISPDDRQRHIWVVLEPGKVRIIDTGHGMGPSFLERERPIVDDYLAEAGKSETAGKDDFCYRISPASRFSLEWFANCVALSAKPADADPNILGYRGIGALAPFQYGTVIAIDTRPSLDIAVEFWPGIRVADIPTFRLVMPTEEQLQRMDMSYRIEEADRRLQDPWGKPLEQGTIIVVTGLRSPEPLYLSPEKLATYFTGRFGDAVRHNRFQLTIVDRITQTARQAGGERLLTIQPPVYHGRLLEDVDLFLPGGKNSFHVNLFYKPDGIGQRVAVRRQGSQACFLTDIEELDQPPWNTGRITGTIDFPSFGSHVDPRLWDSSKSVLLPSKPRDEWIKRVRKLEAAINDQIRRWEEREQEQALDQLGKTIAQATSDAIAQMPFFSDSPINYPPPTQTRKSAAKPRKPAECKKTATKPREVKKPIPRLRIWLHPFDETETLFRSVLHLGMVEINTLAAPLAEALDKDKQLIHALVANYTAICVVFYTFEGSPNELLQGQLGLLNGNILTNLRAGSRKRKAAK